MKLGELIAEERLVVPLGVETLDDAARLLRSRLVVAGVVRDEAKLVRRMAEDRPEDMVAMGDRAFLLHYRTDAVTDLVVVIGTSESPICRSAGADGTQCARIVLLIVSPPRMASRYLRVLGAFARLLGTPESLAEVLAQRSAVDLARLLRDADVPVPEQISASDVMARDPKSLAPDDPLREAALNMVRAGVSGLPVVDETSRVVGMLSERELMRHLLSHYLQSAGRRPSAAAEPQRVRDVMTRQVLCVSPDVPLAEVASLMTNKDVDRIPVVQDGRLVGSLTRGDIVRKLIGS